MRVLLTTWGSLGDLHPYLRIARRLADLGHTPLLATCEIYRPIVERAGVVFHPVRPDLDPDNAPLVRRIMDPRQGSSVIVEELVAPAVRDAFEDLLPIAGAADLIVTHPMTFAAPLVAAFLGKLWLSTVLSPASFFSIYDFPVPPQSPAVGNLLVLGPAAGWTLRKIARTVSFPWMGPVRALRADLGLPDTGEPLFEGQFSPHGTLALFSPLLAEPQRDWPPSTHVTGFVFDPVAAAELPEPLSSFLDAGDPPIVFTLGSSAVGAPGRFYEAAADACQQLGRRGVLLIGARRALRPAESIQPDVLAVAYAPHAGLFPRAAAIVHHGGVGTLADALRAGRPQLIVPFAHDQPDNAKRAGRLGVARMSPSTQSTGADLAAELEVLLDDPAYARAATEIGQLVGGEDGVERACTSILGTRALTGGN